jgi:hypothetical protein
MRAPLYVLLSIFIYPAVLSAQRAADGGADVRKNPYCGCILFIDDFRKEDEFNSIKSLPATHLLRSWYRWGEPSREKAYAQRAGLIERLRMSEITLGGGTSLSIVNDRDLARKDFNPSWLSVDSNGTAIQAPGRQYATLSAPGFKSYLIARLIEQAKLGVVELHLGEPNGEVYFDNWSLGLTGEGGFIQWLRQKYKDRPLQWWRDYLGRLGEAIFNKAVERKDFFELAEPYHTNFMMEWGKSGSWEGKNSKGEPAFLAFLYRKNLEAFLWELRTALRTNNLTHVRVDVWGFAEWMKALSTKPDAFISSPPDERWNLNWSTDPGFSIAQQGARLRNLMKEQIASVAPSPVIYMIDHPKPFQSFAALPDKQQASLLTFFSQVTSELGANFAFRVYSIGGKEMGSAAAEVTRTECRKRILFCPSSAPVRSR